MKNIKWGDLLVTVVVLVLGVYLLVNDHPIAGGWTLAIGLLCFANTDFDIRAKPPEDPK